MRLLLCCLSFACVISASTRHVPCAGDITTALTAAIAASVDGDEISIGSGSCTLSAYTSITNKNITIYGAGSSATTVTSTHNNTSFAITMSNYTKASWRLHDFTLANNSTNNYALISIHGENASQWSYGWRIDHMSLVGAPRTGGSLIRVAGVTYGVIDHVFFDARLGNDGVMVAASMASLDSSYSPALNGLYNISLPLDLGSEKAVYIEDCTFDGGGRYYSTTDADGGGGRYVIRHNSFQGVVYAHWNRTGSINWTKYEIYNNTMTGDAGNSYPVRMEAGTGVIFNNTITGNSTGIVIDERRGEQSETSPPLGICDGTKAWDGNIEASGWPCLGQVGRGSAGAPGSQASVPLYAWNNGRDAGCATGGACSNNVNISVMHDGGPVQSTVFLKSTPHSNGDVDFVNNGSTSKPGYAPYPYPHPLQGGSAKSVAPPTDLRGVAK